MNLANLMACNSCAKPYTLFRKERGCPCCGYSYCSKCLNQTIFVTKLNSNAKVCTKCSNASKFNQQGNIEPPDAYYKLVGSSENANMNKTEQEIKQRLQSLKEGRSKTNEESSEDKIRERLKNLKGPQPSTSDAELETRLANLRGIPTNGSKNKTIFWTPELKTEQEQADDLLKSYLEQSNIDKKYKDGFDKNIENIETRLQKIKGSTTETYTEKDETHSEDEETEIKKIIEKVKTESLFNIPQSTKETNEELPFCEICNEDANMRCLGCLYLFCKRCFMEHKDDDDGCNKYEPYKPPHPS